jgi:hypothetical protein
MQRWIGVTEQEVASSNCIRTFLLIEIIIEDSP